VPRQRSIVAERSGSQTTELSEAELRGDQMVEESSHETRHRTGSPDCSHGQLSGSYREADEEPGMDVGFEGLEVDRHVLKPSDQASE
jgi:hypothetical protein